ncbi:hypothetical protein ACHEVM_14845 [Roseomonas sp. SXEYE002]|uniref:hypothetical protein n=1 Tax=Roseomonas xinghualingensis TaxID=2986475 RepID=UPI0021F10E05|nr:hypothetical protein [Roseomonas sp. SXEYE001]MCV4208852.1 hypothetical protein [Roseomonas sp. SXEYE001]
MRLPKKPPSSRSVAKQPGLQNAWREHAARIPADHIHCHRQEAGTIRAATAIHFARIY